jgi:hypothetical protein
MRQTAIDARSEQEKPVSQSLHRSLSAALLLFTALCAAESRAQPATATQMTGISPAHCIASLERGAPADLIRCPTALGEAVAEADARCREAGGALEGVGQGNVWAIDVNDDGRSELAFELDGNLTCTDAWSLFSCGSHDCPKTLYELRSGSWTAVGSIAAAWPEQVTLGAARSTDGHRSLEVCVQDDCSERWIYEWQGARYDTTRGEIRGTRIEIADSITGLHTLAAATTVRAAPRATGADVGRYEAGTDVAIIGTAGDWYYVSPCNACESGFVPRAAVTVR